MTTPASLLDGRVALVTGATRGIGFAVAQAFVAAGARVVITGRKPDGLADAARALGADDRIATVAGSSDDEAHAGRAVATAVERFGGCHVLVNNAGTNPAYGPLVDVDLGAVEKTWSVNLKGPLLFARAAWHGAMREHGGAIVNIASVGGLAPLAQLGAYNISKAGLMALTRQLAVELAPGVRVNAVAPAVVKTRLARTLFEGHEAEAAARYPLGRLGEPEDVANAVLFLASPQSAWMTGETVVLDGGAMLV